MYIGIDIQPIFCTPDTKRVALFLRILLTKTTAAQNEVALSYHKVRGLYFLAIVL